MKTRLILLFIFGWIGQAQSQYFDKTYSLMLDINMPISNTSYVEDVSARGFKFGYREAINDRFFGGIDFNNATFTEHVPRKTYTGGTNAVTTELFNYIYSYGLTLTGDYFLRPEQKKFMPYVGLGVGASYQSYRQFFNVYSISDNSWGVLVRPELGAMFRIKETAGWAFHGGIHYDYSSAKSEDFGIDAFQNVGFQVGVIILDW